MFQRPVYTIEDSNGTLIRHKNGGELLEIRVYEDGDLALDHCRTLIRSDVTIVRHQTFLCAKDYIEVRRQSVYDYWLHLYSLPNGYYDKFPYITPYTFKYETKTRAT
jgi:hypothetical protein